MCHCAAVGVAGVRVDLASMLFKAAEDTTFMLSTICAGAVPHSEMQFEDPDLKELAAELFVAFGTPFYVFDLSSGAAYFDPAVLPPPPSYSKFAPEITADGSGCGVSVIAARPLLILRLAVEAGRRRRLVALGFFPGSRFVQTWVLRRRLTRRGFSADSAQRLAELIAQQAPWSKEALRATGKVFLSQWHWRQRAKQAEVESQTLAAELTARYEEISFLHRLAQNLRISQTDEELAHLALKWMEETLPAESLAILLLTPEDFCFGRPLPDHGLNFFCRGNCPVDSHRFYELAEELKVRDATRPVLLNHCPEKFDGRFPELKQLIVAPLRGGKECLGFIGAFNHREGKEFGTVEGSLLASVAAILGSHSANLLLYRRQEESLAGIIRALTSAIDAKDAYTCGHSDRVARLAVRLAQELGLDGQALHAVYLAGLLHDIGKIGTSEAILRKPGKLTAEEYEHIKQHVRVGYRILMDLKHLSGVLPAVLHHHEHWDGSGYPAGLAGEEIPLAARIIAVADAFDAMGSDRPYRGRLPDEKINAILREGAGKQWDPQVIEVFFRIRDELEAIVLEDRSHRTTDSAFPLATHLVNGAVPAAVLSPV